MLRFRVWPPKVSPSNLLRPRLIVPLFLAAICCVGPAFGQLTVPGYDGSSISVSPNGDWTLNVPGPQWSFAGNIGSPAVASRANRGKDSLGTYQEIAFDYTVSGGGRTASIRLYQTVAAALFIQTSHDATPNTSPFPTISQYPSSLSHISFNGMFAPADFTDLLSDSPWGFFDAAGNTFILSAASNFMTAAANRLGNGSIAMGISPQIAALPAGFTQKTLLVFGAGINQTFQNWGESLTALRGKRRPANDSDTLLKSLSYWTDNGATYYYNPGGDSYAGTLQSIRKEFDSKGIRLGSLQLDSWWYPKGPDNNWASHSGIWTYAASPALFTADLAGFQSSIKTPLVTHSRWIDVASPYRSQFAMSGNVVVDPTYWDGVAAYLKSSGVTTYEQDWLGSEAQTDFNLSDPETFLTGMSAAMAKHGITVQYCMANPSHFLQSTNYSNVTTIRASQDRFRPEIWTNFFYSSRFASAIGVWPFTDVFMSTELNNLIAATLSAGPVGIGDPLGQISKENVLRSVRADGVIVKPDVSATPRDSVFLNDALGIDVPMVASAWTDFGGGLKTWYLFAYTRGSNNSVTIDPASFGINGAAYFYDSLKETGRLINARSTYTFNLTDGVGYYVLAPVGPSGIAMLGDKGQFVSMGRKRISSFTDSGVAQVGVTFAAGETMRTLFGYSPYPVQVGSLTGSHAGLSWDPTNQIFSVNVHPAAGKAGMQFGLSSPILTKPGCDLRCTGTGPNPGLTLTQPARQ